ncbi:putative Exo-beta-D-glucosaminidase [Paratrimastix pyriformis]|uniref:Exo-beta-D-glucosaminidase n=1 Tax=Paratrimastix pyriformis TaxID=342808 RepID=A0ABQ8UQ41_9EUKA|nr:putative Exo-beta-D-glucosaminidase [Paratrimastix pyriformis]
MDPLSLLRECVVLKKPLPELRDNFIAFPEHNIQFPRDTQTSYQTSKGPYLTLDTVWFLLKNETIPYSEYMDKCTAESFGYVPVVHRRDLLQYMKGEKQTSSQVQSIPVFAGVPITSTSLPEPAETQPASDESMKPRLEEIQRSKEDFVRRLESSTAGSAAVTTVEKIPQFDGRMNQDKIAELKAKRAAKKRQTVRDVDQEDPAKQRDAAQKKKAQHPSGRFLTTGVLAAAFVVFGRPCGENLYVEVDAAVTASIRAKERLFFTRNSILCCQKKSFAGILRLLEKTAAATAAGPQGIKAERARQPPSSPALRSDKRPHPSPQQRPAPRPRPRPPHPSPPAPAADSPSVPPIIMVPASLTALCTIYNARDFLGRVRGPDGEGRRVPGAHPTRSGWPWHEDPVQIFSHVRAYSLQWQLIDPHPNVLKWSVKILRTRSMRLWALLFFAVAALALPLSKWTMKSSAGGPSYPVAVPCTVFAGLIQNGLYTDWWYDTVLQNVSSDPFNVPWVFSTSFSLADTSGRILLRFHGVNYRAEVRVNNVVVATSSDMMGPFRLFDIDVTAASKPGSNDLQVTLWRPQNTIHAPTDVDLAISFVDWAPLPPDQNMGIWREVELLQLPNSVGVAHGLVNTTWVGGLGKARLDIMLEVTNYGSQAVQGRLEVAIAELGLTIGKDVTLAPNQQAQVTLLAADYPGLVVADPKPWWPAQMGSPSLYSLAARFTTQGGVSSDEYQTRFGLRTVTDELVTLSPAGPKPNRPVRLYRINGVPLLIRGAGWSPDLFLRMSRDRQLAELRYVLDMGLNTVRLEGKMEDDTFFELADELGIVIIPGWCCCDSWQHWDHWGPDQYRVAGGSMQDQARRLRIHPSVLSFWYSSDTLPPKDVEQLYLDSLRAQQWPTPTVAAASNMVSTLTGPTAVKMSGPYSYVPPVYFLEGDQAGLPENGAAYGFLTEGGPGEAPLTLGSLARTVAPEHMWPINPAWNWHCGAQFGHFRSLDAFAGPLERRYGPSSSAREFSYKSQIAAYESHRAMFEAYSRNKYTRSTGVIQWMLGNSFPSMIWHLYDYFLVPGGSYFGTKKACEPLHAMYSPNDATVWLVNSRYMDIPAGVQVQATSYLPNGAWFGDRTWTMRALKADGVAQAGSVRDIMANASSLVFMQLRWRLSEQDPWEGDNWYWAGPQEDVLDWASTDWNHTPCKVYANYTEMSQMAPTKVTAALLASRPISDTQSQATVRVTHAGGGALAFMIYLRPVDKAGQEVAPALWSDNMVTLLPGESRDLELVYPSTTALAGVEPEWWSSAVHP